MFKNSSVLLELKDLPFKEKKKLKSAVTENGGIISFVVNKKVRELVQGWGSDLDLDLSQIWPSGWRTNNR